MESLFQSTLTDLVKALRSTSLGEAAFLEGALADCKREIRSTDPHIKATALQKITYITMLQGGDMGWASFHCLEVMSQARFWHKQAGYLAMANSFTAHSNLLLLATNLFKKDLASTNEYEAAQVLNGLSRVLTPSLARDLLPDVCQALSSSRTMVRKRAVLLLHHMFLQDPDAAPNTTFKNLVDKLQDAETSVVCCAANVLCELVCSSAAPATYLPLAPLLYGLLTQSSHTWLVIKLVKLFGVLAPLEPRLAAKLAGPLMAILERTPAKSLAYECVRTATASLPHNHQVMALCADTLRDFIQDSDANLRYLGLLALVRLLPGQAALVSVHRDTALTCLMDADPTIAVVALRLVRGLVATPEDAAHASEAMLRLIRGGAVELAFQHQLIATLLELHSRDHYTLVADFTWYVSVLVELAAVVGSPHGVVVAAQLVDVALRVPDARADLVHQARSLLLAPSLLLGGPAHPSVSAALGAAAWLTGEYAAHVQDPTTVLEALLQPNTALLPPSVQAVYIQSIFKVLLRSLVTPPTSPSPAPSLSAPGGPIVAPSSLAGQPAPLPDPHDSTSFSVLTPWLDRNTAPSPSCATVLAPSSSPSRQEEPAAPPEAVNHDPSPLDASGPPVPNTTGAATPMPSEDVSRGSPGALARLVRDHLRPVLESSSSEVQERAANVAALLELLPMHAAHPALHLLAAAMQEELRPIAAGAQALVEAPEGLLLDASLQALAVLRAAENGAEEPSGWGLEARAREDASTDASQPGDEVSASEGARAAHAAHKQQYGQYYLPAHKVAEPDDTGQQEAGMDASQALPLLPKRKPARAVVRLDEDVPPGILRWMSGEGFKPADTSKRGVLDQSVAGLLAEKDETKLDQVKKPRKHRSKHRDSEGWSQKVWDSSPITKDASENRAKSSRHHKHHKRRPTAPEVEEGETAVLTNNSGPGFPPLISMEPVTDAPVT